MEMMWFGFMSFPDAEPFLEAQVLGVLEEYDAVAHDDSHEADEPQHRGDAEIQAENPEPEEGAEEAQGAQEQSQQREGYLLEVEEQEEEEHQHGSEEGDDDFRNHVPVH